VPTPLGGSREGREGSGRFLCDKRVKENEQIIAYTGITWHSTNNKQVYATTACHMPATRMHLKTGTTFSIGNRSELCKPLT
jgi:hypothetical protein